MKPIQITAILLGGIGIVIGIWSRNNTVVSQRFARELPRNIWLGRAIILIDMVWSLIMFDRMSLGEWDRAKMMIIYASPVIYWVIIQYANDFLGARSLGWLLILAARPILMICFESDAPWVLVLVVLAYLWVVTGIALVAVPHWLRDWIAYWEEKPERWRLGCHIKMVLGVILVILAFIP